VHIYTYIYISVSGARFSSASPNTRRPLAQDTTTMAATAPEDFAALWQLNDQAHAILTQLDPELQQSIMEGFKPREETRNTSDLFISYAKSRVAAGTASGVQDERPLDNSNVSEFINKWGLNSESHEVLINLPPKIQTTVLHSFAPRDEIQNIDNIFQAFAKSILRPGKGKGKGKGGAKELGTSALGRAASIQVPLSFGGRPAMPAKAIRVRPSVPIGQATPVKPAHSSPPLSQPVVDFISERGLDETSGRLLTSLIPHHPETAESIMNEFNQFDSSRDTNELFLSYWRQRALAALVNAFQLSEENATVFNSLYHHPLLQAQIVEEFKPREARDMNKLFSSFMASRMKAVQEHGALVSKDMALLSKGLLGGGSKKRPLDEVSGFITRWNLSPENEQLMIAQLTAAQQKIVMAGFAPKSNTRDVNKLFTKFAQSIQVRA